ncbi:LOW QUALITY PROTEIN: uncharacterized protein LOC129230385 [Uloborus diversus]|uniref:LOW QUALITY PROTEIN: uncharacterized protein LOC129230385 n=1 Tax=Uloborus diversus TaxID=327109 RepID=UPI00240A42F0|nr:LOW QUALITY PROTEIN: uncharacterized protein LOC129230385 [Uloborus diversus]
MLMQCSVNIGTTLSAKLSTILLKQYEVNIDFLLFLLRVTTVYNLNCSEIDLDFQRRIKEGEDRYNDLAKRIVPYGNCWKKSLEDLHRGCKQLTEESQSRLALSFANCFLEHSGSTICNCPPDTPVSTCLRNSSDRVFSTYTEFFTHTQSICHYLQHREWQERTENTVLKLSKTSEEVSEKLEETTKYQTQMLDMQQLALEEQKRLISNGKILNHELQKSRLHARDVYEDLKSTTGEQKLLIFEVFDRIKSLQNLVLGEFTGVYTIAYYLIGTILVYVATSISRTADARIWLLLIISANMVAERVITSYTLDEGILKHALGDSSVLVYERIWLCRKVTCVVAIVVLICFYCRYKDYNAINNQLLREIQQQNVELKNFIKSLNLNELPQTPIKYKEAEIYPPVLETSISADKDQAAEKIESFPKEESSSKPRSIYTKKAVPKKAILGNISLDALEVTILHEYIGKG